jgi:hypothetical protein
MFFVARRCCRIVRAHHEALFQTKKNPPEKPDRLFAAAGRAFIEGPAGAGSGSARN